MSISVVLADDHPLLRQGVATLFSGGTEFTITGEARDGPEAVRLVEQVQPDVLVLDLMMPGLTGLDVLPIVRRRCPRTRVVVFSMYSGEEFVRRALANGAIGYVFKGCDPDHLKEAVRQAAVGKRYFGPAVRDSAVVAERSPSYPQDRHDLLTPREREVLQLSAEGKSCIQIAERLSISPRTAEMHRGNALRKLGLKSQVDVVRYALRRGMLPLEP
jgi:DNA-binding NarL/FixJ family response regulator